MINPFVNQKEGSACGNCGITGNIGIGGISLVVKYSNYISCINNTATISKIIKYLVALGTQCVGH